jgi:hypothetical protein
MVTSVDWGKEHKRDGEECTEVFEYIPTLLLELRYGCTVVNCLIIYVSTIFQLENTYLAALS